MGLSRLHKSKSVYEHRSILEETDALLGLQQSVCAFDGRFVAEDRRSLSLFTAKGAFSHATLAGK